MSLKSILLDSAHNSYLLTLYQLLIHISALTRPVLLIQLLALRSQRAPLLEAD